MATRNQESLVLIQRDVAGISADEERFRLQSIADKQMLRGLRTAFTLPRTVPQRRASMQSKRDEKPLAKDVILKTSLLSTECGH